MKNAMRKVVFERQALEHLVYWAKTDLKILKKIVQLAENTAQTPFEGIGKPEPLKGNFSGYWSRRITGEHRLVYEVTEETISIILCRSHYE
jgi:toxin YoeB